MAASWSPPLRCADLSGIPTSAKCKRVSSFLASHIAGHRFVRVRKAVGTWDALRSWEFGGVRRFGGNRPRSLRSDWVLLEPELSQQRPEPATVIPGGGCANSYIPSAGNTGRGIDSAL